MIRNEQIAFILGPYKAIQTETKADTLCNIALNIQAAKLVSIKYWKMGFAVICPQMNSAMLDDIINDDIWINSYTEIMLRCDVVVMMKDWEIYVETVKLHAEAQIANKIIFYEY